MLKTSNEINELAAALAVAQGEIQTAKADSTNPAFKSKYADLTSVREAIREPLAKNGLCILQTPTTIEGKPALLSRLIHKSGQWAESWCHLIIERPTMQGMGSAITYMKRYMLNAITGLAEEDDDGNAAERHGMKPRPKVAAPIQSKPIQKEEEGGFYSFEPTALPIPVLGKQPDQQPEPRQPLAEAPKDSVTKSKASLPEDLIPDDVRAITWGIIKSLFADDQEKAKQWAVFVVGEKPSKLWNFSDYKKLIDAIQQEKQKRGALK